MDDIYERLGLIRYEPSKEDTDIWKGYNAWITSQVADIIYVDSDSIKIKKEDDKDGC